MGGFELAQQVDGVNQTQLLRTGWTRRLVMELLGRPDEVRQRTAGYVRTEHVYLRSRVRAAMAGPEFAAMAVRRERRRTAPERRQAELGLRYGGGWQEAAGAACRALFQLNRWAKHRACPDEESGEIYRVKDRLIEALYRAGYCTAAWVHLVEQPAKECWGCMGAGCERCDDTGEYLPARTLRFFAFRFAVGRKTYCWHQPDRLVRFAVRCTEEPSAWSGNVEEKPVRLGPRGRRRALELLRWVLARVDGEAVAT